MDLILWRHADAEEPGPSGDAARRLTKKGRKQAERMAEWLRPRLGPEWRIVVSPARRALETVKPLGRECELSEAVGTAGDASTLLKAVEWPHATRPVMVVGHQPTLGEVAALLMGSGGGDIAVRKGAVWWFACRERGGGHETVLKAVMNPELLEEGE
jgi:phosphohistidine phosphatase